MPRSTAASPRSMGLVLAFRNAGGPPPSQRPRSFAIPALLVFVVMLVGLTVAITMHRSEVLLDVPPETRAQLVRQGTLELQSPCRESYSSQGPLRDHCVELGHFVLRFPECGPECQLAANAVLPHAHR